MTSEQLVLLVRLDGVLYGFPAVRVKEILAMPVCVPLPLLPPHLLGVCNYNGTVLAVASTDPKRHDAACLVLETALGLAGLTVPEPEGLLETCGLPADAAQQPPAAALQCSQVLLADEPVFLVDIDATAARLRYPTKERDSHGA